MVGMEVGVWGAGVSSAFIQQQTPFPPTTTLLYKGPEKLNNFEFQEKNNQEEFNKIAIINNFLLVVYFNCILFFFISLLKNRTQ